MLIETTNVSLRSISLPQLELLKFGDVKRLDLTRSRLPRRDHVVGKFSFITLDGEQLQEWPRDGDGKYCASRSCWAGEIAAHVHTWRATWMFANRALHS